MHHLSLLLLLPIFGAILIAVLPGSAPGLVRKTAITFSSLALLLSWSLFFSFDNSISGMQFIESYPWNPRLGTSFSLGIDGLSLPMILLATLLCLIAIMASNSIKEQVKSYYLFMLLLESAMLGVFMAQDWTLFYLFWEFTLIPLFFLIDRWGGDQRHRASLNFFLYTMGGSVFMLLSILLLFDASPLHSFAMSDIAESAAKLDTDTQILIFLGLLIGFGVKMPIFPIHAWLPLAHVQAPSPVSILLSGILLKMGSYGLIKAALTLPGAVIALQNMLAAIALFSMVYGGVLAWKQTDLKRMIAYSSVSHMGVVLLGIAALNTAGISGAISQMVAHGLVAGALFLLIGLLYERTHTREISHYSSLIRITPKFALFIILASVAAVGLPGTVGFIAEFHILIGGFMQWGWMVIILTLGVLISATYSIRTVTRLFTGPVKKDMQNVKDLQKMETVLASVLIFSIFYLGFFPAELMSLISASVEDMSRTFATFSDQH
jgi:NADH-quinone oxidoreductase subunit M